jgi:hypothetical protein
VSGKCQFELASISRSEPDGSASCARLTRSATLGHVTQVLFGNRGHPANRIGRHFPDLDLDEHVTTCGETEAGGPCVLLDGAVAFAANGDDLYYVMPEEDGFVRCYVIEPNGHYYLARQEHDPFAAQAEQAANN